MRKTKEYYRVKFSPEVIKEAEEKLKSNLQTEQIKLTYTSYTVKFKDEEWAYDNESEFFADYIRDPKHSVYEKSFRGECSIRVSFYRPDTTVYIKAPERSKIEEIYQIFESHAPKCILPEEIEPAEKEPTIFLGHGRSAQWRDLKDHLHDKHGYQIEAYEVGARAGHTIRDILEEMLEKSSFAILVMTGEDRDENGILHARDNVVHELGLFQGRLGFARAITLLEEGTEEFSNLYGIQQIRYSKGNIKETFGEILATLRREFER